jgi:hypothetical protein
MPVRSLQVAVAEDIVTFGALVAGLRRPAFLGSGGFTGIDREMWYGPWYGEFWRLMISAKSLILLVAEALFVHTPEISSSAGSCHQGSRPVIELGPDDVQEAPTLPCSDGHRSKCRPGWWHGGTFLGRAS